MSTTRTPLEQTFQTIPLAVLSTSAIQVASAYNIVNQITSLAICNFSTNTNSIFLGANSSVNTLSGYEIIPGNGPIFQIQQVRQLYEIETPTENILSQSICQPITPVMIPLIVWNPSNMWLIAATATTNVSIILFNNVYS